MREINLVFTGGTIEKIYDEVHGKIGNIESEIDKVLPKLRLPYVKIHTHRVMNIDSLYMTDAHRELISKKIEELLKEKLPIVITHGTDTMVKTGLYLKKHLKNITVPIILTGAMLPLVIENSDGYQNLIESIFATQCLEPGIYIVFHNEIFDIDNVRKNREKKTFERIR